MVKLELLEKTEGTTRTGKSIGSKYWKLKLQNPEGEQRTLSYFNYEEGKELTQGFMYEVVTKQNGEYTNIVSIEPRAETPQEKIMEKTVTSTSNAPRDTRDRKISKAQCLNVSATLLSNPEILKTRDNVVLASSVINLAEEIWKEAKERKYFEQY